MYNVCVHRTMTMWTERNAVAFPLFINFVVNSGYNQKIWFSILYGSSISVDMELGDCHVYVPILTYSYYGSERPWSYKSTGSSKKSKALAFKKKLRM